MTAAVPLYLDAMLAAHAAGRAGRSIHLGVWPPSGVADAADFAAAQARLDDLVIESARLADGLALLDVACGLGGLVATLSARYRGLDLTGVNLDPRQLDACHRVRPRPDTILRWVEADACRLPFADASFDRVFCIEAMFHFRSREAFVREAFRVLKPDGWLVVTDILLTPPTDAAVARAVHADLLAAYGPWPEPWSSPGTLASQFATAGFADIAIADLTAATLPSYRFLLPGGGDRSAPAGADAYDPVAPHDLLGRSLAALHRLHAGGNLLYVSASARRPAAETPAERLVRTAAALGAPMLHERSLRIAAAGIGGERFLVSLPLAAIPGDAAARAAAAWRDLGMPAECLAAALETLPATRHLHFGCEGGPGPARYKTYLEVVPHVVAGGAPSLLHVAFKWDPVGIAPPAVTRYLLHPPADRAGILAVLAGFHDGGGVVDGTAHQAFAPLTALIDRALTRMSAPDVQVLEVVEEGGRRSYDVNVSDANLTVGDVQRELEALGRAAGADAAAVTAAIAARAGDRLGHVAGGVHRDGRGFVTIYHGAGPWPPPPLKVSAA